MGKKIELYIHPINFGSKAWFSLAHKHKHKDIRKRRMAYLTQFSIPALLNPMINKMADEASDILLFICSHGVWVKARENELRERIPVPHDNFFKSI